MSVVALKLNEVMRVITIIALVYPTYICGWGISA